jgi:uncharacterized protein (TIGR02118 family)
MVRVIVAIKRLPELSRPEFLQRWLEDHPAYVRRLPGLRGYRQSPAIEHRKPWPFDGLAELSFDSVGDVARAFDGPEAVELFAHEREFLASAEWFIAEEGIIVPIVTTAASPAGGDA